ncbi:hypothetical protein FQN51_005645 [Onygenales sp. PD_10]|nr:hypothetical protein FQN51_005645 [Onygenales sp. PD_10]
MSFNFDAYFRQHAPSETWSTQPLTGGIVNFTVRAVRSRIDPPATSPQDTGPAPRGPSVRFSEHESLVLKYAPPYVALVGEQAPFDRVRQLFFHRSSVLVPRLVHYDHESHVLCIEDLGKLPPLSEYLSPSSAAEFWKTLSNETLWHSIGQRLGHFFADLHSKSTLEAIMTSAGSHDLPNFRNPSMADMFRDAAVSTMRKYLAKHGIRDFVNLSQIVEEDYERGISDEERCFIVGDLWPGGILVGDLEASTSVPKLGVIDWEFSGPGRGINGDISQLFSHLHLYLLASELQQPGNPAFSATQTLIESISASYYAHSMADSGSPWTQISPDSSDPPLPTSPVARIFSSAIILHGREIINNAIENDWSGFCCGPTSEQERDTLVQSMVETGVQCLRLAGRDAADFVRDDNWRRLLSSKEARIMVRLFLGRNRL